MQNADDQIEDVMGQVAAKYMGEDEVIEQDERERVAQRPQKAQRGTLVAYLEVFGDQIAHQVTVLPVTGEASGGGAGRRDGAGLHERNCASLGLGWSIVRRCRGGEVACASKVVVIGAGWLCL